MWEHMCGIIKRRERRERERGEYREIDPVNRRIPSISAQLGKTTPYPDLGPNRVIRTNVGVSELSPTWTDLFPFSGQMVWPYPIADVLLRIE